MTALLVAAAVWLFIMLAVVWPICVLAKKADIAAAQARHPANWQPDTEEAIEQAVAIVDDGKALVGEVEDYLRGLSR